MAGIFISYRRHDTASMAHLLYAELMRHFGEDFIFGDFKPQMGRDYLDVAYEGLDRASIVLLLIGRNWLAKDAHGRTRFEHGWDPIRLEVAYALNRPGLRVLPILIDGAPMPVAEDLPTELRSAIRIIGPELRSARFNVDFPELLAYLEDTLTPDASAPRPGLPGASYSPVAPDATAPRGSPPPPSVPTGSRSLDPPPPVMPPSAGVPTGMSRGSSASGARDDPAASAGASIMRGSAILAQRVADLARRIAGALRQTSVPEMDEEIDTPDGPPPDREQVVAEPTNLLASLPEVDDGTPTAGVSPGAGVVHCSLFAPPRVAMGRMFLVQAIAHTPSQAKIARQLASEHDLGATERGATQLAVEVPLRARLSFELRMRELDVLDGAQVAIVWRGTATPATFEVRVPDAQPPGPTTGRLLVSWDGLPIGDIRFQVEVVSSVGSTRLEPAGTSARRFEQAFKSYASPDHDEVIKRVQGIRMAGIKCFQDVLDLEPGQRWERELYRKIDESDVFFLFWSRAARDSEWVQKEIAYALQCRGEDEDALPEIRPVALEAPTMAPPPPELAHLQFGDPILDRLDAQAARRAERTSATDLSG